VWILTEQNTSEVFTYRDFICLSSCITLHFYHFMWQLAPSAHYYSILPSLRAHAFKFNCFIAITFQLCLEYAFRQVQVNQECLKLNGTYQLLVYAHDVTILGRSIDTIKKTPESLLFSSMETSLEINYEKTKYMVMSWEQNAGKNLYIKIDNKSFKRVEQSQYLGTTKRNQNSIYEAIKSRLISQNACYCLVQNLWSCGLLSKNTKIKIHRTNLVYCSV